LKDKKQRHLLFLVNYFEEMTPLLQITSAILYWMQMTWFSAQFSSFLSILLFWEWSLRYMIRILERQFQLQRALRIMLDSICNDQSSSLQLNSNKHMMTIRKKKTHFVQSFWHVWETTSISSA
jgi:hypothetical protein